MSKKYFAKYIVQTGPPKSNKPGHREHTLKLFLSSRDIKVGDKVKINTQSEWVSVEIITLQMNGNYGVKSDTIWGNYSEVFKVIGEISSQAVWVKEGDEFDEEEINKQWLDDSGSDNFPWKNCIDSAFITAEELWEDSTDDGRRIQIKCPTCKHFH